MIQIASQQQMKMTNMLTIFRLIHTNSDLSRSALAKKTGLSPITVSALVEELINKGLVVEGEPVASSGAGRKAIALGMNNSDKL